MSTLTNWLLAIRPRTLVISVMPVLMGTVLAFEDGVTINRVLFSCCIACSMLIQVGANLFNDAIDFKKGADTTERLGPTRVSQSGLIESDTVMLAGSMAYALAVLFSIPLIVQAGWVVVVLGILSLCSGYFYTAGPFSLAYKGLGELFVILFFGLAAVMGSYYVQLLSISLMSFVAGMQIGVLACVVIAINNLRDIKEDSKSFKKTLAVRFGALFACYEIKTLILSAYILSVFWLFKDRIWAFVLPLITLPFALALIKKIHSTPASQVFNEYLYNSIVLFLSFSILSAIGQIL